MLPPEWKKEIDESIEKTANRDQEHWKRIQDEIITPIRSLADHLVRYVEQQNTADEAKARRERATIWGIFITAAIALATAGIFYFQLRVFEASDHTFKATLDAQK